MWIRDRDDYAPEADGLSKRSNKVVNINSTMQLQVVLVKPERFDDASAIADHLNACLLYTSATEKGEGSKT